MDPVPWREAWHEALYAADRGFYVAGGGPAAHFTTATHGPSGAVLARALLRLFVEGHGGLPTVVVDVGAGRGELMTHLLDALADPVEWAVSPTRNRGKVPTRVVGVDVVERPDGLDERIEWHRSPGGADLPNDLTDLTDALVVAHEWLDVVPCTVAEVDSSGTLRELLVDRASGDETPGAPLSGADLRWAERQWPGRRPGARVEVGRARDEAWAALVHRVRSGTLVAVDYGHLASGRPDGGTLTAYASGGRTRPVPDGSCDLTAHVAMDSLDADEVRPQRECLRALGVRGRTPDHGLARTDPQHYLALLARAGAEAQLLHPDGFGAFWWAVRRIGTSDLT